MAEEIIIRIVGTPTTGAVDAEGGTGATLDPTQQPTPKNDAKTNTKTKKAIALGVGALIGKQAFSFATSNVGKYTGDAKLQQNINTGLELIGYATVIFVNPILGSVNFGLAQANKFADLSYQRKWDSVQAGINAERLGLATTGRSGRNINRR